MNLLISYAMSFVGTPYKFGGNNPMQGGLDCSGYVNLILRFGGEIGVKEDLTAQGIYDKLEKNGSHGVMGPGSIAFFGKSVREITHVAFMVDQYRILEAGGGNHKTQTIEDAAQNNAMVRGMILKHRSDLVATIKPRYSAIGFF